MNWWKTKRANKLTLEECVQEKDAIKNKFQFIIEKGRKSRSNQSNDKTTRSDRNTDKNLNTVIVMFFIYKITWFFLVFQRFFFLN